MTGEPRTIRLVLDTSAALAWTRGSLAVGELIAEIDDENGAVILPLPCLIEAAHLTGLLELPRLDVLVAHRAVFLLSDDPADWQALAALRGLVGTADRASAAMLALDAEVDVLTRDPSWYAAVAGGKATLEFDD
ncbi:hypothetical protein AB0F72_39090 [Actinoplanes sp. NPDC023936]|uniref:hypothetical protein n=1 Tax=Actinoplanes sp. NPDC023936 TaxID=3154910 RepID=UPI0033F94AB0